MIFQWRESASISAATKTHPDELPEESILGGGRLIDTSIPRQVPHMLRLIRSQKGSRDLASTAPPGAMKREISKFLGDTKGYVPIELRQQE